MKTLSTLAFSLVLATGAIADDFNSKQVQYTIGGTDFMGTVVWEAGSMEARPGILMIPNWMGPTEASLEKAKEVAEEGYVVMMADMYGVEVRPSTSGEAAEAAGAVRADRMLMRSRAMGALEVFRSLDGIPLEADKVAAIGFCFGGGTVLEMARGGADVDAVISFHGDLLSPTLETDSKDIATRVLVLHGAEDPYVPQDHVQQFIEVMLGTEADWQLVQFANAVHSFTDPNAASPGKAEYNPLVAERAFEYMDELLEEMWEE